MHNRLLNFSMFKCLGLFSLVAIIVFIYSDFGATYLPHKEELSFYIYPKPNEMSFKNRILLIDENILRIFMKDPKAKIRVKKEILLATDKATMKKYNSTKVRLIELVDDEKKDYVIFKTKNGSIAVPKFSIIPKKISWFGKQIEIFIPNDIEKFLWYWKRGSFFECQKVNVMGRKTTKQTIPLSFIKNMASFRDLLAKHNMTGFLMDGSLLGWRRECSIIPHTTDIDFGMLSEEHSESLINDLKKSKNFTLYWILGMPNDSMEISVYANNIKIDLFYVYKDTSSDSSFVGAMDVPKRQKMRWNYPRIHEICAVDLLDHLMYVPCNVEKVLEALYGPDWAVDFDSSKFEWNKSHKNLDSRNQIISEKDWKLYYQKFVKW